MAKYIKKINGIDSLGAGIGNMILASSQIVTGLKTFLDGTFGLRNVSATFTSFFTNTNRASRTYTLQNRNGILADDTDLATKQATLVSSTNIKTVNGTTILGSGDLDLTADMMYYAAAF